MTTPTSKSYLEAWQSDMEERQKLEDRIAELEKVAEAARELAAIKYPVYSGPKSADVKKGAALSGELLYYKVLPHLMHKLDKALLGGGG